MDMTDVIGSYRNGNYTVTIYEDGTKVRQNELSSLIPDTIESMDIKITNYCDCGCKYCHEDSTIHGKHGDIMSPSFLDNLHPFTELAIGGGNPLSHPDLIPFLEKCKRLNLIPSMTVNQVHFEANIDLIRYLVDNKLIWGLGISLVDPTFKFIELAKQFSNAVIHIIAGVVTTSQLTVLANNDLKILILGYKDFRRGSQYLSTHPEDVVKKINILKLLLPVMISSEHFKAISFDNLAIQQLEVRNLMSEEDWKIFYMGDDGFATMYVDMVERKFALNSCAPIENRYPLLNTIEEMFYKIKENN